MRTPEGSNRVRNGLMGILVLLLVIGVGQSFASVPMLFATPTYYAAVLRHRRDEHGDKVRIAGVDVGEVADGDRGRQGQDRLFARRYRGSVPAVRSPPPRHDPRPCKIWRSCRAALRRRCGPTGPSARPDHDAVPDLRRLLRSDRGGVGLGHRDGEAVTERAVRDHRPDLAAPERRARRGRAVLRHHRQARRPHQGAARQRQPDRRYARLPQRADQRSAGERAVLCCRRSTSVPVRGQPTRSSAVLRLLPLRSRASSTTTRTSTRC